MQYKTELAEMADTADYAAMNYGELLKTKLAFNMAVGLQINPLLEEKRLEEMAKITHIYITAMNGYDATRSEILTCLEVEGMKETRAFTHTPDVDDQAQDAVPGEESLNEQARSDAAVLLLPEHVESMVDDAQDQVMTVSADVEEQSAEEPPESNETASMEANNETLVEEAMSIMRALPVPKDIDPNEPYYMECDFSYEGELGHSDPSGRNMRRSDLEEFRSASEVYYRIFMKKKIIKSTEDCIAYNDSLNTYKVRLYHFPEDTGNAVDTPTQDVALTAYETKELKKKKAYLRKAIKLAKEYTYSDETDVHTPFYDRYKFSPGLGKNLDLKSDRVRVYEDAANLTELMPAFESYARLFQDGFTVMVKDNCVAAMRSHDIYVVQFNIPVQEKKKRVPKKSAPAAKKAPVLEESKAVTESTPASGESDLILKAVEMTKALPAVNGTDVNLPYYIQSNFCIAGNGNLIYSGKPFSSNVSIDDLEKYKQNHRKYARAMKASSIVSTEDYTALVWNDGKNLTVFSYDRGIMAEAS